MTDEMKRWLWPQHLERGTPALNSYIETQLEIVNSFIFTTMLASRADEMRVRAATALSETLGPQHPDHQKFKADIANPDIVAKQLNQFSRINSQNLINNSVNAFTRYLSEIIQACIMKEPRLLTGEDQLPVKSIIGLRRMSDVIQVLVERRVNKLSYGSIKDTAEYIEKHFGIRMFDDEDRTAWVKLAIEVRNINVHNGGVVNAVFLDRVSDTRGIKFTRDTLHHNGWDIYEPMAANLVQTAVAVDEALSKKFRLKRMGRTVPGNALAKTPWQPQT